MKRFAAGAEGAAGGGMVTIEVNGLGDVLACRINPSVATDRELIEDLIPAAVNAASVGRNFCTPKRCVR